MLLFSFYPSQGYAIREQLFYLKKHTDPYFQPLRKCQIAKLLLFNNLH
jgi:hypothetical protein